MADRAIEKLLREMAGVDPFAREDLWDAARATARKLLGPREKDEDEDLNNASEYDTAGAIVRYRLVGGEPDSDRELVAVLNWRLLQLEQRRHRIEPHGINKADAEFDVAELLSRVKRGPDA
jgi:hypothetical protein